MAQSDFEFLAAPNSDEDSSDFIDEINVSGPDKDLKSRCKPASLNNDELFAFVTEWELSAASDVNPLTESTNMNTLPEKIDESIYEPIRRVLVVVPPKRFFRRLWSLMSRRILEHAAQLIHPHSGL